MTRRFCSVDGCAGLSRARNLCPRHLSRLYRLGGPSKGDDQRPKGELRALLKSAAVATTSDCIIITGFKQRPKTHLNGKQMNASRAVWIIANGDPGASFVLHNCHRGMEGCVNIQHLYLGDAAQNGRDTAAGGRRKGIVTARGETANGARLTADIVREIRSRYQTGTASQDRLAVEYGVSQTAVSLAIRYKTWRHIA